jgi:polyhydroxybutyrate depolymerase
MMRRLLPLRFVPLTLLGLASACGGDDSSSGDLGDTTVTPEPTNTSPSVGPSASTPTPAPLPVGPTGAPGASGPSATPVSPSPSTSSPSPTTPATPTGPSGTTAPGPVNAGPTPTTTPTSDAPTSEEPTSEAPVTGDPPAGDRNTAGCGAQNTLQNGTRTLDINGKQREYILKIPNGYDNNTPYRLIFVWHPLQGSASQVSRDWDRLERLADNTAIFVAPNGLEGGDGGASGRGWWNVDNNDMLLFKKVFEEVTSNLCVDKRRVFSTGFSFGGMMSYSIGFETDVFRAIAPTSGGLNYTPHQKNNTAPLAIMAFHGDVDRVVPLSAGQAARDAYVERNNCQSQTQPYNPSPCVEYQGCDVPTIWCQYSADHTPWSQMPDAVWEFFSQFE